ncbi:transposase [Acinetobacter soli]|nr:transposase [Acinetobacter soli]
MAIQYNPRLMYLPAYSPDLNPIEKSMVGFKKKSQKYCQSKAKNCD